jgi:hypothetical protein
MKVGMKEGGKMERRKGKGKRDKKVGHRPSGGGYVKRQLKHVSFLNCLVAWGLKLRYEAYAEGCKTRRDVGGPESVTSPGAAETLQTQVERGKLNIDHVPE